MIAVGMFSDVAWLHQIVAVWQVLDHLLTLLGGGSSTAIYNVDSCLAEVEDLLSYCNDILCTGNKP